MEAGVRWMGSPCCLEGGRRGGLVSLLAVAGEGEGEGGTVWETGRVGSGARMRREREGMNRIEGRDREGDWDGRGGTV